MVKNEIGATVYIAKAGGGTVYIAINGASGVAYIKKTVAGEVEL